MCFYKIADRARREVRLHGAIDVDSKEWRLIRMLAKFEKEHATPRAPMDRVMGLKMSKAIGGEVPMKCGRDHVDRATQELVSRGFADRFKDAGATDGDHAELPETWQ